MSQNYRKQFQMSNRRAFLSPLILTLSSCLLPVVTIGQKPCGSWPEDSIIVIVFSHVTCCTPHTYYSPSRAPAHISVRTDILSMWVSGCGTREVHHTQSLAEWFDIRLHCVLVIEWSGYILKTLVATKPETVWPVLCYRM